MNHFMNFHLVGYYHLVSGFRLPWLRTHLKANLKLNLLDFARGCDLVSRWAFVVLCCLYGSYLRVWSIC